MSVAARVPEFLTVDEFLELPPIKPGAELVGGVIYLMTGSTDRHNRVQINAIGALLGPARDLACELFVDMALQIDARTAYYPDVMAVCRSDDADTHLKRTRPCLIIEVQSPSTKLTDQREKRIAYTRIESMRDYFMVNPTNQHVEHHFRVGTALDDSDDTAWRRQVLAPSDIAETTCLGPLRMADLWIGHR